jgi:hypothetical protein
VVALADDDQAPGEEGEDLTWTLPAMADPKRTRLQEMEDLTQTAGDLPSPAAATICSSVDHTIMDVSF